MGFARSLGAGTVPEATAVPPDHRAQWRRSLPLTPRPAPIRVTETDGPLSGGERPEIRNTRVSLATETTAADGDSVRFLARRLDAPPSQQDDPHQHGRTSGKVGPANPVHLGARYPRHCIRLVNQLPLYRISVQMPGSLFKFLRRHGGNVLEIDQ